LQGIAPSAGVDGSASAIMWRWARGDRLEKVLTSDLLSPGDFVRLAKQVLDVADHVAGVAPTPGLHEAARDAMGAVRRGVVAASSA
jgi:ATP-dependent RNA helicase HelY